MVEDQDREPSLPPLPAVSWDAEAQSFAKRKRNSASQIFSDSSDPAIFSSDDDPALDNYVQGRRKKRYVGSWFEQFPANSDSGPSHGQEPREKRTFERQLDSGVFMGSDASIDEVLYEPIPPPAQARLPQLIQVPRSSQLTQTSEAETMVKEIIQRCVDNGDENIDLSGLGLEHIPNSTISVLSQLVRIPNVTKGVPFEHQDPELKLFLFSNQLTRVPGAIFDLDHLTTLSLRGNRLTELPPAILKLRNLQTLNVSQNSLKYLPVELLELIYDEPCPIRSLELFPNPLCQPQGLSDAEAPWNGAPMDKSTLEVPGPQPRGYKWGLSRKPELHGWFPQSSSDSSKHYAKMWARTPVHFKNTRGSTYSRFWIDLGAKHLETEDLDYEPEYPAESRLQSIFGGRDVETTKVPSLTEVILRNCAKSSHLSEMAEILTGDSHASSRQLVVDTQVCVETGGMECTVCKRPVIKPTAEWIEWWEILIDNRIQGHGIPAGVDYLLKSPEERLIPFIRRACSWKCVKDPVRGLGKQAAEGVFEPSGVALPEGSDHA